MGTVPLVGESLDCLGKLSTIVYREAGWTEVARTSDGQMEKSLSFFCQK